MEEIPSKKGQTRQRLISVRGVSSSARTGGKNAGAGGGTFCAQPGARAEQQVTGKGAARFVKLQGQESGGLSREPGAAVPAPLWRAASDS